MFGISKRREFVMDKKGRDTRKGFEDWNKKNPLSIKVFKEKE
jgi:hypothetical protein